MVAGDINSSDDYVIPSVFLSTYIRSAPTEQMYVKFGVIRICEYLSRNYRFV